MSQRTTTGLRIAAAATVAVTSAALLAGCSSDGRETIRFTFSKREALDFMGALVQDYNASQDDVRVEMDTTGVDVVSASFVRGNPPDIMLANYNYEVARFVQQVRSFGAGINVKSTFVDIDARHEPARAWHDFDIKADLH